MPKATKGDKSAKSAKAAKTTKATRAASAKPARGRGQGAKIFRSKSVYKGKTFNPAAVEAVALSADRQVMRPRQAHTRYPIPLQLFLELKDSFFPSRAVPTVNGLMLWSLANPLTNPIFMGRKITVCPFSTPPPAEQKGGCLPLDSGDVGVANAVFRGGSVWCALTTAHDFGSGNVSAVQWFQIDAGAGTLTQQCVYGDATTHYFYPAVMPDSNGNMVMVFSRCSPTEFASVRQAGRKSTDPLGTLRGSAPLKDGLANYVRLDRSCMNCWVDYAGIGNDPADPLKVWFYSAYVIDVNTWATHVGAVKF